jgi:hypothetical protein
MTVSGNIPSRQALREAKCVYEVEDRSQERLARVGEWPSDADHCVRSTTMSPGKATKAFECDSPVVKTKDQVKGSQGAVKGI